MFKNFFIIFCTFFCFTNSLLAEGWVSVDNKVRLYFENVTSYSNTNDANADDKENSDVFAELYSKLNYNFNERLAIKTTWQLLLVKDDENEDRFFEDQGLVIDELYINYEEKQANFFIGKFNPKFAKAWDVNLLSAIWSNDLAEEYRLTGKIGVGAAAKFDLDDYGSHNIEVNSFYDDDSSLNDSMFSRRDRTEAGLGDMSDTDSLSSYTVNLSGSDFWFVPSLFYNLSYRSLEGSSDSLVSQEEGFSVGFGLDKTFASSLQIKPYFEYVKINGFNSFNNRFNLEFSDDDFLPGDAEYYVFFMPATYGKWTFSYLYSMREVDTNNLDQDYGRFSTEEFAISFAFIKNYSITVARKEDTLKDSFRSQSAGIMLQYNHDF